MIKLRFFSDYAKYLLQGLGFLSIAGETKLRLLPRPWPADRLPKSSASLLSIAPAKGLLAAAGPENLIIASTESVRKAYTSDIAEEQGAKPFTPQISLQVPRVSQVAFSADGSCLVITAEEGGGLAVYDVQALQQGQTQSAFQLTTNGLSLRALVPNPALEFSHLFAVVLTEGQLLIADLKEQKLITGGQGPCFREGVACVSWSAKGKQLVAGLQDGTAEQYDHQGNKKAVIPIPNSLSAPMPLTTISWLANDDFLVIHTPVGQDSSDSVYHILHRDKSNGSFTSAKFAGDPTPAFGLRHPAQHFISRLKSFPPNLDDMLILCSTAGTDIGVFTRSTSPLTMDLPAEKVTNIYTSTSMSNDARRAQMPMSSDGMGDTSPIGMVIDLSSKDLVKRPLPTDDLDETATPLPALMILDNEGRLSTWWIMYTESIRGKTAYPGLANAKTENGPSSVIKPSVLQSTAGQSTPTNTTPAFGSSSFGSKPVAQPAFGSASTPGFGGASTMGQKPSVWGTSSITPTPAFGQATFGTPSSSATTFGSTTGMGTKVSPWATSSSTPATGTTFGQATTFGAASGTASAFAQATTQQPSNSPFGTNNVAKSSPFAITDSGKSASPFANFGKQTDGKSAPFASTSETGEKHSSPFAKFGQNTSSAFGSTASTQPFGSTSFGKASALGAGTGAISSPFSQPSKAQEPPSSPEATMSDDQSVNNTTEAPKPTPFSGFKLVSGFKADPGTNDNKTIAKTQHSGQSLFGSSFGETLNATAKSITTPPKETSLTKSSSTPFGVPKQNSAGFSFGQPAPNNAKTVAAQEDAPLPPDFTGAKALKESSFGDVPLPPDPTFKADQKRDNVENAPLPPDFSTSNSKIDDTPPKLRNIADDESSDLSPPISDGADHVALNDDEENEEEELAESHEEDDDQEEEVDEGDEFDEEEWVEEETGDDATDEELETPQATQHKLEAASTTPFGSRLTFPDSAAKTVSFDKSALPSTTPAGLPKGPIFAPPQKESPRSPSPIRKERSVPKRVPTKHVPNSSIDLHQRQQSSSPHRPFKHSSKQQLPEIQHADLEDDEADRIKVILALPIEPTKTLEPFVAHQDYIGGTEKSGLGGQVENIFRDVNSMIDTLGLNARSLESFIRGHESVQSKQKEDLEEDEEWCLIGIDDLRKIEDDIDSQLDSAKLDKRGQSIEEIASLYQESLRMRARTSDIRRQIALHNNAEKRTAQRNAPLDTETEMQQNQLRKSASTVQKSIQEVEEQLSLLRAQLASIPTNNGTSKTAPTVEAVTNTIMKMTAMIQQKSADVDLLEAQIRRLPQGLASLSLQDDESDLLRSSTSSLRASRRGLPISQSVSSLNTPISPMQRNLNRQSFLNGGEKLGLSGMLGSRFLTPPHLSNRDSPNRRSTLVSRSSPSPMDAELAQSTITTSANGQNHKTMHMSEQDINRYRNRLGNRRKILESLKATVEKKGSRIVNV